MSIIFPENPSVPVPFSMKTPLTEQLSDLSSICSLSFFEKLNANQTKQNIITNKVKKLTEKVNTASQKIDLSNTKIEELEGGKLSKLFLVGGLVKALFQWFNQKNLILEKSQIIKLKTAVDNLKNKINTLNDQEKNLSLANAQLAATLKFDQFKDQFKDLIKDQKSFTAEEVALIFDVESKVRKVLMLGDFPQRFEFQNIYDRNILPLAAQAKQFLAHRPLHFSVQAAAAKGKAAQAGFGAIQALAQNKPILENNKISNQEVFLLPEQGAVFKRSHERANEEERLVNDLFDLMVEQAVVPTFNINKATLERFEIQIDPKVEQRSFSLKELSPTLSFAIRQKLTFEDDDLWQYFSTTKPATQSFLLTPDLSDPATKKAYERCEQFQWTYKNKDGQEKKVNFKTLHANFLQGEVMTAIKPIPSSSHLKAPNSYKRILAFNTPWKIVSPEIMERHEGHISPFVNIQAKPFVRDMHLFSEIMEHPVAYQSILQKLTPEAEFQAILTGELQLLDLHSKNLGVAPQTTEEYERFKGLKFTVNQADISFKQLLLNYLSGDILDTTIIKFKENNNKIKMSLKDLPDLQKALNVQWQFVIFDTDLSLSENNHLQFQTRKDKEEYLIPVRSVLLETTWKDQPLSEQTIQRLLESTDRDLRVENWVKREDSPIRKRLSPKIQRKLDQDLIPLIENYALSVQRYDDPSTPIKKLQEDFAKDLSDISNSNHLKIWKTLEEELNRKLKAPYDLTSSTLQAIERRKKLLFSYSLV